MSDREVVKTQQPTQRLMKAVVVCGGGCPLGGNASVPVY